MSSSTETGELPDDEDVSRDEPAGTASDVRIPRLERGHQIELGRAIGGEEADDKSGDDGHHQP